MKKLFICICVLVLFLVGFYSCDSTTAPDDILKETPVLDSFSVTPHSVNFTPQDGFKDTTLTFSIVATIPLSGVKLINPYVVISEKASGDILAELEMSNLDSRTEWYEADFDVLTSTTSFTDYNIALIYDEESGGYAQTSLQINGFSNSVPFIIETESPGTINRPATGEIPAIFLAKVTDSDGQNTIDKVYLRVINQISGEVQGSPFEMFDDGSTYNDEAAGDSTYTWFLPVTPTQNDPNRDFDIEFFAIDKGGLSSDTIRTTFHIRE